MLSRITFRLASTTSTSQPLHNVYSIAQSLLKVEQLSLETRIKAELDPIEKAKLDLALAWTIPENQVAFDTNQRTQINIYAKIITSNGVAY